MENSTINFRQPKYHPPQAEQYQNIIDDLLSIYSELNVMYWLRNWFVITFLVAIVKLFYLRLNETGSIIA